MMSKLENKTTKEIWEILKDEHQGKVNVKKVAKDAGIAKFGFKCFLWIVRWLKRLKLSQCQT